MKPQIYLSAICAFLLAGFVARSTAADPAVHQHHHVAPNGGTAIELGDELYHLELVLDPAVGKLTAYVLDGEMENFIRIPATSIELTANVAGEKRTLSLKAMANFATGETVGDTSQFELTDDCFKTTKEFDAVLAQLDVRGNTFTNVAFNFPKGNDHGEPVAGGADGKKKTHKPHVSPRGGTLVEVGDHKFNVDFVLDATTGTLHGYLLNAHAKGVTDIAKVAMSSFTAVAIVNGKKETLVFKALANPATGEKPGDTSVFEAQADWLKTTKEFDGVFPKLVFGDTTFTDTAFNFPKGRIRK